MTRESPQQILRKHIPEGALPYCLDLMTDYPFRLKLKNPRQSKVGDFCARHGRTSTITINRDLNPYLFLTTFIHEFSHHAVYLIYGNKPEAHGKEWKLAFKTFMGPIMEMKIFPDDLQECLEGHLKNPKASSFSDTHLTRLFQKYDPDHHERIFLNQISSGTTFKLGTRIFKKGVLQRTRVLCTDVKTKRQYLVPNDAEIKLLNDVD